MENTQLISGSTIVDVTQGPSETGMQSKVEKKGGKRIGFNYIILKSIKESLKNDVVKCIYIKSLFNFGICVIKEGTYGGIKDQHGRDIRDRLIWQKEVHEALGGKIRLPRFMGSFEEGGNYYLALEYVKGRSLYKICKDKSRELREALQTGNKTGIIFLDYLLQIVTILETLHERQYVHRDVTAGNFVISPKNKVSIIDMELSYSLPKQVPSPPFILGTFGYMSPEQQATKIPTTKEDIFSLGALFLFVWTGIIPGKMTAAPMAELIKKVNFFVPDKAFADIIIQCLSPTPEERPTLQQIHQVVASYKSNLQKKNRQLAPNPAPLFKKEQISGTIQQCINTLGSPLLSDEHKGWFAEDYNESDKQDNITIAKAWYTSFSRGASGIIYALSKANLLGFDITATQQNISKGLELIASKYIADIENVQPGLYFGSSGIAACLATAIHSGLVDASFEYTNWITQLLDKENQEQDIMQGVAGQGLAYCLCNSYVSPMLLRSRLDHYTQYLLGKQEKDGSWIRSITNGKKRITRGFANGVAGIVYYLLEYAHRFKNEEAMSGAARGLQWLIKKSVRKDNSIYWRSNNGEEIVPWWWDGAPGIALSFIKGFAVLGEAKYQEYAHKALYTHHKYGTDGNLSQGYGLSGLGETYLEAWRVFKEEEWFDRAGWLAQVIMHLKKEHPVHGPFWLVQSERQPVPDFMSGNCGILHFLLRYCYPERVSFPLLP